MKGVFLLRVILLHLFVCIWAQVFGQELERLPPVLSNKGYTLKDTGVSFIFNTLDFHLFMQRGGIGYANSIQIIDADMPWPPRWFTSGADMKKREACGIDDIFIDARQQNGYITFYREEKECLMPQGATKIVSRGYLKCNRQMEVVENFNGAAGENIDYHDFRINENGEKLVAIQKDTLLDMRGSSGNMGDSAVITSVAFIEVLDKDNHVIFKWNPVEALGANAPYFAYGNLRTFSAKEDRFDWAHNTGVKWDFDGNILYCFRYIGVGKISRKDGHVMWRLDRNKMPYVFGDGDTLAVYSQHDLNNIADSDSNTTYRVYSNGDQYNPESYLEEFTVSKNNFKAHFLRKIKPHQPVYSMSGGNYEEDKRGNYLFNYGGSQMKDTISKYHPFLEYGRQGKLQALYSIPSLIVTYKVHELNDWKPPRPEITMANGVLEANGAMADWIWYRINGDGSLQVVEVGRGASFQPKENGIFCVAGKFGIGYAVSRPFVVAK